MVKQITPVVPSMPALTAVQDPAVRRVLQSFQDGWTTRNGKTAERFITAAELKDRAVDIVSAGLKQAVGQHSGSTPGEGSVGEVVEGIESLIKGSWLWQHLGQQLTWLSEQNNLSVARIVSLGEGIISERIERVEGDTKLISTMDAMKVVVDNNSAAIMNEQEVRASSDSAMVKAINTMWAVAGVNNALIQNHDSVEVNWNAAQASRWSQLQAEVFGTGGQSIRQALAQEANLRSNADGTLFAQYSVKIDQNGYVSGFGLSSEANNSKPYSSFFIRADRFAIGEPGKPKPVEDQNGKPPEESIPFIVLTTPTIDSNGVAVPAGVYIKDAFIKNAAVDTLKIKGNAVTVPLTGRTFYTQDMHPNTAPVAVLRLSPSFPVIPQTVVILVNVVAGNVGDQTNVQCVLKRDGMIIGDKATSTAAGYQTSHVFTFDDRPPFNPPHGTVNYDICLGNNWRYGGPWRGVDVSAIILGAMR